MAHLLGIENASASLGAREILHSLTIGIDEGDRIGVVGPNGVGKSTLLRLLSGELSPTSGRCTKAGNAGVVIIKQIDSFPSNLTVLDVVHPNQAEHEWASNPLIRSIHAGLLEDIQLRARVSELSGGQLRRVALASVLAESINPINKILVLDEPTNHLDVEGVAWLSEHLNKVAGTTQAPALVVVTHDRWFLDSVCNNMWEIVPAGNRPGDNPNHGSRVEKYEGGYAAYVLARAERARQASLAEEKRQNLLRKELAWLRRGAPARTSKPKFRIEAAETLISNVPPPRDSVALSKTAITRLGKEVINLESVEFAYPGGRPLFQDLTWRLAPGERVGVVGVNGAGKSTLLQILAGNIKPQKGKVKQGKTVKLRMLSQDTRELSAVAELRVVEAVAKVRERVMVGKKELTASQIVERLGFTRQRAWTAVRDLSGGERRRLQLLRLIVEDPNVLLLDEPTNDIDTDTLAAIEDLLDDWAGTLVVVSHDRYILERITDKQVALYGDGKVVDLPRGVEQYIEVRAQAKRLGQSGPMTGDGKQRSLSGSGTGRRRLDSGDLGEAKNTLLSCKNAVVASPQKTESSIRPGSARQRELQKELTKVERQLESISSAREQLGIDMAQKAQAGDLQALVAMNKQNEELMHKHTELEERWCEIVELIG